MLGIIGWIGLTIIAVIASGAAIQCTTIARRKEIHVYHHLLHDQGGEDSPEEPPAVDDSTVAMNWEMMQ